MTTVPDKLLQQTVVKKQTNKPLPFANAWKTFLILWDGVACHLCLKLKTVHQMHLAYFKFKDPILAKVYKLVEVLKKKQTHSFNWIANRWLLQAQLEELPFSFYGMLRIWSCSFIILVFMVLTYYFSGRGKMTMHLSLTDTKSFVRVLLQMRLSFLCVCVCKLRIRAEQQIRECPRAAV